MSVSRSDAAVPFASAHVPTVLGMAGFIYTVASVRYAKDSDKAPTMPDRIELLHMCAHSVNAFDQVGEIATANHVDFAAAVGTFAGTFVALDERLRPLDWQERLVKTYLGLGILTDFCAELVQALPEPLKPELAAVLGSDPFPAYAAAQITSAIQADPQLSGRLGLWGRRVVGDEIGTLLQMLAVFPQLLAGEAKADKREGLHQALAQGAASRMRALGLRV